MAIHPEVEATYFGQHEKERLLARSLDEGFDVSFAKDIGDFAIWFLQPQAHLRERFGLDREVLALYSGYQRTDARAIRAIQETLRDRRYFDRLDRVLSLLIHRGRREEGVALAAGQTDRIIVALTEGELTNPRRGDLFLRAALADAIGSTDLFAMSSAITSDKYFFGRDDFALQLAQRAVQKHENSGVFGLRKTGKTSVLFAVRRLMRDHPVWVQYVDCQNPGLHGSRWWKVLEHVVFDAATRMTAAREIISERPYERDEAGLRFSADVQRLLDAQSLDGIVLLLDEIEYITHGISGRMGQHWDEDFIPFWQTIRATHQQTEGKLTFIVAGVNPTSVESSHLGDQPNPIFQLAVPQYLDPLGVQDIRRMVGTLGKYGGLDVEDAVYEYLASTYGGHPYLIRLACSEVWQGSDVTSPYSRPRVSVRSFQLAREAIRHRLAQPIRDILLSLVWWYPDEYALLQILAGGDTSDEQFVSDYLTQHPGSVMQFARYGLLLPDSPRFAIADVEDFLRTSGEEYKRHLSPFTRGDIPPELLPEMPDLDRLGRLFEMRTRIELLLRRAVIMYLGIQTSWDQPKLAKAIAAGLPSKRERPDPSQLFVGRTPQDAISDLYTSDLHAIVMHHWDTFAPLFGGDRSRTDMNLETLNRARRVDAHAKPMKDNEVRNIENSYGWLYGHLGRIPGVDA